MDICRRRWGLFPLALAVAGIWFPPAVVADVKAVPEVSIYRTHNNYLRSRFSTAATWSKEGGDFTSAAFEYDLDLGLASFFRRYVFKDPNAEKSKRVSFRAGYAYIPDLTKKGDADEKRVIAEATFRFPLGNKWLMSDRNRMDFRNIEGTESSRYRNRLRFERNIALGGFKTTPYSNAEAYYDGKADKWNRLDATIGAEFPWRYSTILEAYVIWQFERSVSDNQTIGLTLQKHL